MFNFKNKRICNLALATISLTCYVNANACPTAPPNGLVITGVGDELEWNGVPMAVAHFSSKEGSEKLISRVVQDWKSAGHTVKVNKAGHWTVVAALGKDCLSTMQVAGGGQTEGLFAVTKIIKAPKKSVPSFVTDLGALQRANIKSTVSSKNDLEPSTTLAFESPLSAKDFSSNLLADLNQSKWTRITASVSKNEQTGASYYKVTAQSGKASITVVTSGEKSANGVINVIGNL
jgi:hypothetical protein